MPSCGADGVGHRRMGRVASPSCNGVLVDDQGHGRASNQRCAEAQNPKNGKGQERVLEVVF